MATEEEIREETRNILSEANLDETSGKSIRVKVGEALGLLKEQINEFRPVIEVLAYIIQGNVAFSSTP